jgi:hypothetical protein
VTRGKSGFTPHPINGAAKQHQIACLEFALAMAEEHGWQTIKAEWYFKMLKQEVTPVMPQVKKDDRLSVWAEAIRTGKDYLCRNIPSTGARELVIQGIVTPDQCRRAGVAL